MKIRRVGEYKELVDNGDFASSSGYFLNEEQSFKLAVEFLGLAVDLLNGIKNKEKLYNKLTDIYNEELQ